MLRFRFLPALLAVALALADAAPSQWISNTANGSDYMVLPPTTWQNAHWTAIALGGRLAVIADAAENQWIVDNLLQFPSYIGGNDAVVEGVWTDPDGSPLTWFRWAPGQPDNFNNGEDYLEIYPWQPGGYAAGEWNDGNGQTLLHAIIERPTGLLRDDFSAPVLDATRWLVVTQGVPSTGASVSIQNGECLLANRGYLATANVFDAMVVGAYQVQFDWYATDPNDSLRILLRSDATPTGAYGEVANGIGLSAWFYEGPTFGPIRFGSATTTTPWVASGPGLVPAPNTVYRATLIDLGHRLVLRIENRANPAQWVRFEADVLSDTSTAKRIVVYNREPTAGQHVAHVDDFAILTARPLASYEPFGVGCPDGAGGQPSLFAPAGQAPRIGTTSKLRVAGLPTSPTVPVFVMGFSNTQSLGPAGLYPLPIDLGVLGWPGCMQLVSVDDIAYTITTTGFVEHSLSIPPLPFLAGLRFYAQALVLYATSEVAVTNGIIATAGW